MLQEISKDLAASEMISLSHPPSSEPLSPKSNLFICICTVEVTKYCIGRLSSDSAPLAGLSFCRSLQTGAGDRWDFNPPPPPLLCIFLEGNLRARCIGAVVEKQQGTSAIRLGRMACRRPS